MNIKLQFSNDQSYSKNLELQVAILHAQLLEEHINILPTSQDRKQKQLQILSDNIKNGTVKMHSE